MWRVQVEARQASRKWYNIHLKHERRNAHAEAERRQDEVFGCIPHERGALQDCSERVGLHEMVLLNGKQGLNYG